MYTKNTPLISIVMPVYNVQDTLGLAIASVLQQSFSEYELILVDDGSTDNSSVICQIMSLQDERVRMVRQSNKGLAAARNTGIENARGDIVAFLDSDDVWHKDKLTLHYQHLIENPNVGVSYSASQFIDACGQPIGLFQTSKIKNVTVKDILLLNPVGNGSSPVIRKATLNEIAFDDESGAINFFDSSLRQSEDIECWVRIAATTKWQFAGLENALTSYRVSNHGLSANTDKQLESWECAIEKMRSYAPQLIDQNEHLARANQYRYLARRAIRSQDADVGLSYICKAIIQAPSILLRQPSRSGITLLAALGLKLLPIKMYELLETSMIARLAKLNQLSQYDAIESTRVSVSD